MQVLRIESLKIPHLLSLLPSHWSLTFGLCHLTVSAATIQLCHCSTKAVIDNTYIKQMHGDMLSTKLYLKKKNREWVEFGLQTTVCQPLGWREDSHNYKSYGYSEGVQNSQ